MSRLYTQVGKKCRPDKLFQPDAASLSKGGLQWTRAGPKGHSPFWPRCCGLLLPGDVPSSVPSSRKVGRTLTRYRPSYERWWRWTTSDTTILFICLTTLRWQLWLCRFDWGTEQNASNMKAGWGRQPWYIASYWPRSARKKFRNSHNRSAAGTQTAYLSPASVTR
jgi:hypothetical protein